MQQTRGRLRVGWGAGKGSVAAAAPQPRPPTPLPWTGVRTGPLRSVDLLGRRAREVADMTSTTTDERNGY